MTFHKRKIEYANISSRISSDFVSIVIQVRVYMYKRWNWLVYILYFGFSVDCFTRKTLSENAS